MTVPVNTLDSVVKSDFPCLVKIDVEGFETEVVKGAGKTLASEKCVAVIMEVGGGARYGFDDQALYQTIVNYGFELCSYDPFSRRLNLCGRNSLGNGVFVRNREMVQNRLRDASVRKINGVDI